MKIRVEAGEMSILGSVTDSVEVVIRAKRGCHVVNRRMLASNDAVSRSERAGVRRLRGEGVRRRSDV